MKRNLMLRIKEWTTLEWIILSTALLSGIFGCLGPVNTIFGINYLWLISAFLVLLFVVIQIIRNFKIKKRLKHEAILEEEDSKAIEAIIERAENFNYILKREQNLKKRGKDKYNFHYDKLVKKSEELIKSQDKINELVKGFFILDGKIIPALEYEIKNRLEKMPLVEINKIDLYYYGDKSKEGIEALERMKFFINKKKQEKTFELTNDALIVYSMENGHSHKILQKFLEIVTSKEPREPILSMIINRLNSIFYESDERKNLDLLLLEIFKEFLPTLTKTLDLKKVLEVSLSFERRLPLKSKSHKIVRNFRLEIQLRVKDDGNGSLSNKY